MRQKGFATIFGLCMILVVALIVRSIQDAEANHAREVVNFETEQALNLAAESAIVEAAEKVRLAEKTGVNRLPYSQAALTDKKKIPVTNPNDDITVEVWGERGKIYRYTKNEDGNLSLIRFKVFDEDGAEIVNETYRDGVYFMGTATIDRGFFGGKIYRRAFAYVHSEKDGDVWKDDTTIHFLELPTEDGNTIKKSS